MRNWTLVLVLALGLSQTDFTAQEQSIQDFSTLVGERVIAQQTPLCQPGGSTSVSSYAGKVAKVISVKPATAAHLSEEYLSGLSPKARAMMEDQQRAATILVQFDDGTQLETCGPVTPMNLSDYLSVVLSGDMTAISAPTESTKKISITKGVLTDKDILDMNKAGLPSEVLVAKIKSSACDFDTSPSQLQLLKTEGVPDAVILAMVEAPIERITPLAVATTLVEKAKTTTMEDPAAVGSTSAPETRTVPPTPTPQAAAAPADTTAAPASDPTEVPARVSYGKIRLFVTDEPKDESIFLAAHRSGWQISGHPGYVSGSGGSAGAAYGYSENGADPRTVELEADLYKSCPTIVVTNDPSRGDYALLFRRQGGKRSQMFIFGGLTGLALSAHSKVDGASVFDKNGDMVYATRERTVGKAIKEVCGHLK